MTANQPSLEPALLSKPAPPRDWILIGGSAAIFAVALAMRFWRLDQFAAPVFDEVYFPVFARNYLDGKPFFDVHPPLGKYLVALGLVLYQDNRELSYRAMTALFGSCIPVLVVGTVYRLTYQRGFALLSGALLLTDGVFLVESRFGLINVYLVAFGFAAQIFLLAGLEARRWRRAGMFVLSGLMLGASTAVKWNGLFFAAMFVGLGLLVWLIALIWPKLLPSLGILAEIRHLRWWHYLVCFLLPMVAIYFVQWIPHLMQNPQGGIVVRPGLVGIWDWLVAFGNANKALWEGQNAGNLIIDDDTPVHPYCSTSLRSLGTVWPEFRAFLNDPGVNQGPLRILVRILSAGAWSWPVMARPVGYYFKSVGDVWTDVHALGNPLLWWLSTLSILILSGQGLRRFRAVPAYLLIGYAANYLPWFVIGRCSFIYHYMSPGAFSFIALAYLTCGWLQQQTRQSLRFVAAAALGSVLAAWIFFLPIWLGIPLSVQGFYARMWFRPNPVPLFCSDQACNRPDGGGWSCCAKTPFRIPAIPGFNWV